MRKLGMRIESNPFAEPKWFQVVGSLEAARESSVLGGGSTERAGRGRSGSAVP
jgi:hypothetical protein